ncbi:MAG: hypothetical protein M3R55_03810 [Acidobacteriota bacterium]|nr:hypothetical protein [Acidobacteriota bacterium]
MPAELNGTPQLLLVLSTTCRYCTQSMPFYTQLAKLPQVAAGRLRLSVVSLQSQEQMQAYLEANGLRMERIVSLRDSGLNITGTPVLVLVSPDGIVRDSWGGWLPPAQEAMVLDTISHLIPS